jgi:hypothetical protein
MNKTPVTETALIKRLNRRLLGDGEVLKKSRVNSPFIHPLGEYYTVDLSANAVSVTHVDVEDMARDMGVLKPYEEIAEQVGTGMPASS